MRNSKGSFCRTDEISREPSNNCPNWLEQFAERMVVSTEAAKQKTSVEVARERGNDAPSIFEMMSAIVSGTKPKYSSVDEAVEDYQERTGVKNYLRRKAEDKVMEAAKKILAQTANDDEENPQQPIKMPVGPGIPGEPVEPSSLGLEAKPMPVNPDEIQGEELMADDGCSSEDDSKKKV